jgi:hypothetical protein
VQVHSRQAEGLAAGALFAGDPLEISADAAMSEELTAMRTSEEASRYFVSARDQ